VLIEVLNRGSSALQGFWHSLGDAGGPLLQRAQDAGIVRKDIAVDDVMRLVSGITAVKFADESQRDKVLAVALDGLRQTGDPAYG
jgi:hypothetical protein